MGAGGFRRAGIKALLEPAAEHGPPPCADVAFVRSFVVPYNFELRQRMRLKVFDMDEKVWDRP